MGKTRRKVDTSWIPYIKDFLSPRHVKMFLKGEYGFNKYKCGSCSVDSAGTTKLNKYDDVGSKSTNATRQRRRAEKKQIKEQMEG